MSITENNTVITFIENPPFKVDFKQYSLQPKQEETRNIVQKTKSFAGILFSSVTEGIYQTAKVAIPYFKLKVLGYRGQPNYIPSLNLSLTIFKIIIWATYLLLGTVLTIFRLVIAKTFPTVTSTILTAYTSRQLDPSHIKSNFRKLDASSVPSDIKVNTLTTIFAGINFEDKEAPEYLSPTTLVEDSVHYTAENLKESLNTFIKHVNERHAFIGTPPEHDTSRLFAFYQQIEDAVRLSIYKSNLQLENFLYNVPDKKPADYSESEMRQYKNILEDRARIALDLAIAGKHCGARYMGEAMNVYNNFHQGDVESGLTLNSFLIETLANKRKKIAEVQQQTLGNDAHAYGNYMSNMGRLVGLPGTENIIEHLSTSFDRHKYLKLFFEEYNETCIIETIQNEFKGKNSQIFREKLIDWIQNQVADWNKEAYDAPVKKLTTEIETILSDKNNNEDLSSIDHLCKLNDLLTYLTQKSVLFQTDPNLNNDWDEFVENLFTLPETKAWRTQVFPGLTPAQLAIKSQTIKQSLKESSIGKEILVKIKLMLTTSGKLELSDFTSEAKESDKLNSISNLCAKANLKIDPPLIVRMINGTIPVKDTIEAHFTPLRKSEFLFSFKLINSKGFPEETLSPELIEWLLVSNKILLPQT